MIKDFLKRTTLFLMSVFIGFVSGCTIESSSDSSSGSGSGKKLSSIEITTAPTKTEYLTTDTSFDASGLVVKATYEDGSVNENVASSCSFSGYDFSTSGSKIVTVSYSSGGTSKTASFNINVTYRYGMHQTLTTAGTCTERGISFDEFYFGDYPQTVKKDGVNITSTTDSHGYYLGSDGNYYKKCTENANSTTVKYSDGTTPTTGSSKVSYFMIEPIKWRVLTTKTVNGKKYGLLLSEKILCSDQGYNSSTEGRSIGGNTVYPNNYKYSTVRAFLNGKHESDETLALNKNFDNNGFLQTAFSSSAQSLIGEFEVDNTEASCQDASGTGLATNSLYICSNTNDKIFLLSRCEATTSAYGFAAYNKADSARVLKPTDYAIANNLYVSSTSGTSAYWFLRSPTPCDSGTEYTGCVNYQGYAATSDIQVNLTYYGIVPALYVCLE